jgi:two-component system, LytTR family, response regulator
MRILIVEEDTSHAEFLKKMLNEQEDDCEVVGIARTVKEASRMCNTHRPDVLMSEVRFGGQANFELFEYIDASKLQIIFTTNHEEHAFKAFRLNAIDYLLKPIDKDDLQSAITKAKERYHYQELSEQDAWSIPEKEKPSLMLVWVENRLIPIKISEIIKLKSDGTYSKIYLTNDRKLHTSKHLGGYELILREFGFIRIHHSCLMNPMHLVSYKPGVRAFVTLTDERIEYVSKNKKKDLLKVIRIPLA